MRLSPIQGAIETMRLLLSSSLKMPRQDPGLEFISPLPPQYQAPPNLFPNGQDTFLPPINPGGIIDLFPDPINVPTDEELYPGQNPNEVPQDISDLLSGR